MSRLIITLALIAGVLGASGTAMAAKPARQGCMGETVSSGARVIRPYGQAISDFARAHDEGNPRGLGDEVQALQDGLIPDADFPNTCND